MLKRLWVDEGGAIISAELVLVLTIVGLGMIVGLVCLRDAVVNELADFGAAIGALNMSYTIAGTSMAGATGTATGSATGTAASIYQDAPENGGTDQTALVWGMVQFRDVGADETAPAPVPITFAPGSWPHGY